MTLYRLLLVTFYLCAQAQAALILSNLPKNQTQFFNLSSLTVGEDAGIDPRFSVNFEDLTDDLSDKSTYMSALSVMFALSESQFEWTSCGGIWKVRGFEDVEISFQGSVPGKITLQTRFMMWGLYYTVKRMANENFVATKTYLFWDQGGHQTHVGFVFIQKSSKSQHRRLLKRAAAPNCHFSELFIDPSEPSVPLGLLSPPTKNASEEISSFAELNTTNGALNAGKSRFQVDFDGPRLTKYGIFVSTLQAMVALASFPRDRPSVMGITLGDYQSKTQLDLRAIGDPQTEAAYLVYKKAIWLLRKVPIYMYGVNRFEQCTFTLLDGNVEIGRGSFKKNPYMAETAIDAD